MKHLKLLCTAFLALFGLSAQAQEDITEQYLQNADLSVVESGWDYYSDDFKYTDWKTDGKVPVVEFYAGWESLEHTNFKFSQTITLPAGDYRIAVNAFFRNGNTGDGTNPDKAWIFAGDKKQNVIGLGASGVGNYEGSNDLYKAATAFSQGDYSNAFDFSLTEETTLSVGFEGVFAAMREWCILGPVKLYKYSLDTYLAEYETIVSQAEALYDEIMNKDVLSELKAAVIDKSEFRYASEVTAAIATLNEKITAAKTSIQNYKDAKAVLDAASTLTATGQADYAASEIIQQIQSEYNARTLVALTSEQKTAAKEALAAAVKKQTENGADYTPAAPLTWDGQSGTYQNRFERYNNYVYTGEVMSQTIEGVPAGAYEIVLEATASTTTSRDNIAGSNTGTGLTVLFANDQTEDIDVVARLAIENESEYGPYTIIGKVGEDGVLKYGLKNIAEGANWFVINIKSITKVEYVAVRDITASDVEVEISKTAEINASVAPANATLPKITYTSADEAIATVDADGVVTGVALGTTTITLKADDVEKTINVNVVAPAILPESITLNETSIALDAGDNTTFELTATITPADAVQDVTFTSSDESIATVTEAGVITAVGIGEADIIVTSKALETVTATAHVVVSAGDINGFIAEDVMDGKDYWIVNAATGKFLGGANAWGTRASLIKHGIPFKTGKVDENVFTLDSYTSNGGDNHYLAGEWIDGAATNITLVPYTHKVTVEGDDITINAENKAYNLMIDGKLLVAKTTNTEVDLKEFDGNSLFAQWYFIGEEDLEANFLFASEDNPIDATFLIKDFNFSRNNTQYSAWEAVNVLNAQNDANSNIQEYYNMNCESWHKTFSMNQTLILPNGKYRLKAQGFYEQNGDDNENLPYFYANDEQQILPVKTGTENSMNAAAASFTKGLYTIEPIEVTVDEYVLNIGVKNEVNTALWCIWDNFELECIGIDDEEEGIDVVIGETGYSTLYYQYLNLTIPEGVSAFTATLENDKLTLVPVEGEVIPKGTAVVLKGNPGDYTFGISLDETASIADNVLLGTDKETTISAEGFKYYMLSTKGGDASTLGWYYQVEGGASITNGAHKAYLQVADPAPEMFNLIDPTGINDITINGADSNDVYSISGVRMNKQSLQKGLYIINGKKVIVK